MDGEQLRETAAGLRALLADLDAGRLSGSAAFRNRIEGAVLALDTAASGQAGHDGEAGGRPPVLG